MHRSKNQASVRPVLVEAFSLLELLVTMAIIAILVGLSLPILQSMQSAYNIDTTAQGISSQLNLARQNALALSHPVQVRFYQIADYNNSATKVFRAMQSFVEGDTATTPITKPYFFPATVKIFTNTVGGNDASSLLDTSYYGIYSVPAGDAVNPLPPPFGASSYTYFRFRSDGQIDKSSTAVGLTVWSNGWLTLALETAPVQANGLPSNYATVQLNSLTGVVNVFRP